MAAGSKRKVHVQQLLFRRGGKRKGAGRKPKGARAGSRHDKRARFESLRALHVTLRVVPEVGSLRQRGMYHAIREATAVAAVRERFRIVHLSLQATHIHMLVEAESHVALARGMQGFQISAARNINTVLGVDKHRRRRGRVFADRYHASALTSPRHARHVISYVLNNWRKHHEDRADRARTWLVDPFSTGLLFPDWQERQSDDLMWKIPAGYHPLIVYRPRTWLLAEGWKRTGPISLHHEPSRPH